ncbi:hypothetical protein, partial [Serratia marcescens]|uniref:hypothetical protein n=1 Tax=Serratia marcescens TaxID=615 RepID=UPI001954CB3D
PELAALRAEVPNFWFIARDEQGHRLSEGEVPDQFKAVAASLDYVSEGRLGWKAGVASPPAALIRWHDTAGAGKVQI